MAHAHQRQQTLLKVTGAQWMVSHFPRVGGRFGLCLKGLPECLAARELQEVVGNGGPLGTFFGPWLHVHVGHNAPPLPPVAYFTLCPSARRSHETRISFAPSCCDAASAGRTLQRKVLDGEALSEVEEREMGALLKGKEAAQKVGRKPSAQEKQAQTDVLIANLKRKFRKK
jgi:hypothetical protein